MHIPQHGALSRVDDISHDHKVETEASAILDGDPLSLCQGRRERRNHPAFEARAVHRGQAKAGCLKLARLVEVVGPDLGAELAHHVVGRVH